MTSTSPLTTQLPLPLQIDQNVDFTPDVWAKAMLYLVTRIAAVEKFEPSYQAAIDALYQTGLERLNDVLIPLYENVANIGSLGAIFQCQSAAAQPLTLGSHTFLIDNIGQRSVFAPSQWMSALSSDGISQMAGYVTNYDRTNGLVTMNIVELYGTGTSSNWVLSPSSPPMLTAAVIDGGNIDSLGSSATYVPYVYAGPNAGAANTGSTSSGIDGGVV